MFFIFISFLFFSLSTVARHDLKRQKLWGCVALEMKTASSLSLFKKKKKKTIYILAESLLDSFPLCNYLTNQNNIAFFFFFFYLSPDDESGRISKRFFHSYPPGQISLDVSSIQKAIVQFSTDRYGRHIFSSSWWSYSHSTMNGHQNKAQEQDRLLNSICNTCRILFEFVTSG